MPLLKGKPLKQHKYRKLNDDQEVFFCELTNEIFETYEEYSERVMECNCMTWTCAITGKSELTYQEALDSEEKALKNIKDFAPELRTPVLYLASLTSATHFSELADIVFNFVKNRYFVGESVQACFEKDTWSFAQVLSVTLPTAEEVLSYCDKHGLSHPINHRPYPAELYKYEVEEVLDEYDDEDDDEPMIIRRMILSSDQVRRVKGLYSKDKNRAYLKQFTEQKKNGLWKIKSAIMDKYGITTIAFNEIFVGEAPILLKEPRLVLTQSLKNGSLKQQSMTKFLNNKMSPSKNALIDKGKEKSQQKNSEKKSLTPKKSISHQVAKKIQKKYAATIDRVATNQDAAKEEQRQKKLEMIRKQKEAKKQEKERLNRFAKEWQKKREDLECEDLKELPVPCSVDCRVPNHLFGEFVMILEFLTCFKQVLKVKDYFPYGLTFEMLERALADVEVAGPLSDILQLLLSAIFVFQDDEDDEVKQKASCGDISLNESGDLSAQQALQAATQAARWSQTYHNVPLNKLHLDAITVTDILRLHLLASGGRAGDLSSKWRLQERGGYVSTDDPGLELRRKEPHILKFLAHNCVAALPIEDKLKVVSCLMNQIITYASVRDVMDERYEKVSHGRKEIKIEQILDGKKEKERLKKVREDKEKGEAVMSAEEREQLASRAARRQADHQRRLGELSETAMGYQVLPLGQDRAHRRYWIFSGLPGLFVEDDERWPGHCLPHPTVTTHSPAADEDDTMSYIRKLFEAGRTGTGSDKENECEGNQVLGSPKKKHLSESNGVSLPSPASSEHKSPIKVDENRALICTANEETCSVHNPSIDRTRWLFFYKEDEVDELIKSLNKRGYRESALRETLVTEKDRILQHLNKCPVQKLNRFAPLVASVQVNKVIGTRSMKGYEDANLKFPTGTPVDTILEMYLRDVILDTEEKIFGGGLGCLKVENRKAWREAIEARCYESQDPDLTWPTKMTIQHSKKDEEDLPSRPVTPCSDHSHSDVHDDPSKPEQPPAVRDLAMAVLQLARSVEPKYLQKPLPYEEKRPVKLTAMERWELSLMHSTSFSQVYLHHASLDNSIQWNKSVLNAKCKICRRGKDDVNMLLCDGCNRGFHLYCLKPKLASIPKGDWFCLDCRPKEKAPVQRSSRRRLLQEEEEEDDTDDEPLVKSRVRGKRKRVDDSWEEWRPKRTR